MPNPRLNITMTGLVQGVGFRPHVYRTATQLNLTGWVRNDAKGVCLEVQGKHCDQFVKQLQDNLPPLAQIDALTAAELPPQPNEQGFRILSSQPGEIMTQVAVDGSVCKACLTELFDPGSRFYHYPFINCTDCGPRYTITRQLPYDRQHTSMAPFAFCANCEAEYHDVTSRRYHAQPIACPDCGPQLSMPLSEIIDRLAKGEVLAIKSLGGYQLVCDARHTLALQRLRAQKQREAKPFAIMVPDIAQACVLADCSDTVQTVLASVERPIVLAPKRPEANLPDLISPGLSTLGLMLPYTPLHHLLFAKLQARGMNALVVTSANLQGEPILIDDAQAKTHLSTLVDAIVSYNREIVVGVDDSVVGVINEAPYFVRRARAYVPKPIKLKQAIPNTLAMGGYLKNTFCITRGDEAFVSQHIGDLDNAKTIHFFHDNLRHLLKVLDVTPECVAHDLHPDFYTTQLAQEYDLPSYAIQHHHAHLAAVVAEHHLAAPVLGVALDGFGFGSDGEAWGGELLRLDGVTFERLGYLKPLPQLGGDEAARAPWRMAAGVLYQLGRGEEIAARFADQPLAASLLPLFQQAAFVPMTSSAGRLFDAASALLNVNLISQYEGQAAMQLESLVTQPEVNASGWQIENNVLNTLPLLAALLDCDPVTGANLFHGTLAAALADWINQAAQAQGLRQVVLSGGCFLNRVLTSQLFAHLQATGLQVFLPRQLPPHDGGISLGQAWLAGHTFQIKHAKPLSHEGSIPCV